MPSEAEVCQFNGVVFLEQNVFRFEIAMDDSGSMRIADGSEDLLEDFQRSLRIERTLLQLVA